MSNTARETVINARVQQTGNAADSFKKTAAAARDLASSIDQVNSATVKVTKSMQDRVSEEMIRIRQQKKFNDELSRRLAAEGIDKSGNRLQPQGQPPAGQMQRQIGQGAGAVTSMLGMGNVGGMLGGVEAMGGPAAMGVAVAAAAMQAMLKGIDKAGQLAEIAAKPHFSQFRKEKDVMGELDILGIGEKFQKLSDAVHARPEMEANKLEYGNAMVREQAAHQQRMAVRGPLAERDKAALAATAAGQFPLEGMPHIDRSTIQGQRAWENNQRRQPAQDAMAYAQRKEFTAKGMDEQQEVKVRLAKDELDSARKRQNALDKQVDEQRAKENARSMSETSSSASGFVKRNIGKFGGWGQTVEMGAELFQMGKNSFKPERAMGSDYVDASKDKANVDTLVNKKKLADMEAAQAAVRYQDEINRKKGTELELQEALSQKRKAGTEQMKAELDILKAAEQRQSSQNTRMGSMNKGQRMSGLAASRFIEQNGMGAATPEIIAAAQSFAPEFVQKKAEQFGENTDEAKAGRKEGFLADDSTSGQNLAEIRKNIDKVQAEVKVDISLDEKALAEGIGAALQGFLQNLLKEVTANMMQKVKEQETGRLEGMNAGP